MKHENPLYQCPDPHRPRQRDRTGSRAKVGITRALLFCIVTAEDRINALNLSVFYSVNVCTVTIPHQSACSKIILPGLLNFNIQFKLHLLCSTFRYPTRIYDKSSREAIKCTNISRLRFRNGFQNRTQHCLEITLT